jgi:hypothetical protein
MTIVLLPVRTSLMVLFPMTQSPSRKCDSVGELASSQNSLAVLSHPCVLDPAEKQVAAGSGSGVVGMV